MSLIDRMGNIYLNVSQFRLDERRIYFYTGRGAKGLIRESLPSISQAAEDDSSTPWRALIQMIPWRFKKKLTNDGIGRIACWEQVRCDVMMTQANVLLLCRYGHNIIKETDLNSGCAKNSMRNVRRSRYLVVPQAC